MTDDKVKIVFVGHIDHGKSTLIGRLLYDTQSIEEDKVNDLRKNAVDGNIMNFAFIADRFEEEQKQGITIDTTQLFFETSKRRYVIIDAPGHVEFIVNMITGAAQADVAVLIIDVTEGIKEQTKRHAYILSMLGVKRIIVAVNKMDLINYDEKKYIAISKEICNFLNKINYIEVNCVPVSAINGDNIAEHSNEMKWYKEKSFVEIIDNINMGNNEENQQVVIPIQDIYNIKSKNKRIYVGRIECGNISVGQKIDILPYGKHTFINTIEKYGEEKVQAENGECIGITIEELLFVERGNILYSGENTLDVNSHFRACILLLGENTIKLGERLIFQNLTQEEGCTISRIFRKINSDTLDSINNCLHEINMLEVAEVEIKTQKDVVTSSVNNIQALGRFVLTNNNVIVAIGIIAN